MQNKKLFYFGIGLLFVIIFISGYLIFAKGSAKYFICSYHFTVFCYQDLKEGQKIPCFSDRDCSVENMKTYCSPSKANLFTSSSGRYYCGDDKYCKRCYCGGLRGVFIR